MGDAPMMVANLLAELDEVRDSLDAARQAVLCEGMQRDTALAQLTAIRALCRQNRSGAKTVPVWQVEKILGGGDE